MDGTGPGGPGDSGQLHPEGAPGDRPGFERAHKEALIADGILRHGESAPLPQPEVQTDDEKARRARDVEFASAQAAQALDYADLGPVMRAAGADALAPELRDERRDLRRLSERDGLTGLASADALAKAVPAADRDPAVSYIFLDGDNFGPINKAYSHDAGDAIIIAMSEAVQEAAAEHGSNRVFRRGGDEMVILANPTEAEAIIAAAREKLRERVSGDEPLTDRQEHQFPAEWFRDATFSAGIGTTLAEADTAMREDKMAMKRRREEEAGGQA